MNTKDNSLVLAKTLMITDFIMGAGIGRNDNTAIALRVLALTCEHPGTGKETPEGGIDLKPEEIAGLEVRAREEQLKAKEEYFNVQTRN